MRCFTIELEYISTEDKNDYFDILLMRLCDILQYIAISGLDGSDSKLNNRLLHHIRRYYPDNPALCREVEDFISNYDPNDAIRWYAKDSFAYCLLNTELRAADKELIFSFSFFVRDLHNQLTLAHTEFIETSPQVHPIELYRGQLTLVEHFFAST